MRTPFNSGDGFRPLIRGFFFYVQAYVNICVEKINGFRPLIRGFFFYADFSPIYVSVRLELFPSPHSGILFLSVLRLDYRCGFLVSVPSFGDSFFMQIQ